MRNIYINIFRNKTHYFILLRVFCIFVLFKYVLKGLNIEKKVEDKYYLFSMVL